MTHLETPLFVATLVLFLALTPSAQATLIDRGSFDDGFSGFVNLIYDDDRNITWLGDANFAQTSGFDVDGLMTWATANNVWAPSLTVGGFTDWRLPTTLFPDSSCGADPFTITFNCTGSEMGHLFYDELGGTAGSSILTSSDPDLGLFMNIQSARYWSGTEIVPATAAWRFAFNGGSQVNNIKTVLNFAWAVRDGDVAAVPEPSTLLLLGSGLMGLAGWRWRKTRAGTS